MWRTRLSRVVNAAAGGAKKKKKKGNITAAAATPHNSVAKGDDKFDIVGSAGEGGEELEESTNAGKWRQSSIAGA